MASMRHLASPCGRPTPYLLPPLKAGRAVAGPAREHLREIVHAVEILELVRGCARQQPYVDQQEDDAAQILGGRDPPVLQHRRGEQAELLEREVPAGPGQLAAGEVAAGREPAPGILRRPRAPKVAPLRGAARRPPRF